MRVLWLWGCLFSVLYALPSLCWSGDLSFTPDEQRWMKAHPVITYSVRDDWPQEFRVQGQHQGLSRGFLDLISENTGLKFVYISAEAREHTPPMMLASSPVNLVSDSFRQQWFFTKPWISTIPMIISLKQTTDVRSLAELNGKTLAVTAGSNYPQWLREHYPDIHLVIKEGVKETLQSVENKESDAALGSGLIILPIYQRLYAGNMAIAAQVPEMATGVSFAVDKTDPMLKTILDKSLGQLTAGEVQQVYEKWVGILDFGSPTLGVIWTYYRLPLVLFLVLVSLLALSLYSAVRSKRRAQQSERSKSEFLAIMSHEIRTPMNAIMAALELLRTTHDDAKRREYEELAHSSSQNLLELLNDILDYSRLSKNKLQLEYQRFSPGHLLEAVGDSHRPAASNKGLIVVVDIEAELQSRFISADAHRLRQVIDNLLSNAIKFTHVGSVTLKAWGHYEENTLNQLFVQVSDTGIGIAEKAQHRLFEAWEQADKFSARNYGGSGLGLYICHQLIQLMKGEMSLKSILGKGTSVDCVFPVQEVAEGASAKVELPVSLPDYQYRLSLLVVEDHPANQVVLREQLQALHCESVIAGTGQAALELLYEENYYDLILLDCNLPGRDGYDIAREIRQYEIEQHREPTPIVAISALNTPEHFQRCLESGMDAYLVKPLGLQDLIGVLRQLCPPPLSETTGFFSEVLTRPAQLWEWLEEDVENFKSAYARKNLKEMIHFIHRIKGVAQLYAISPLDLYAAEQERLLREGESEDPDIVRQLEQFLQPPCPPESRSS